MTTTSQLTLPPQPASVAAARRFVVHALLGRATEGACDDAATLVSELATNAVLHARTPFTVEISIDGSAVRIGVLDHSSALPRLRDYGTDATTGRGIRLVESMSSRWGVRPGVDGKLIWFELPVQGLDSGRAWEAESEESLLAQFSEAPDRAADRDAPRAVGRVA